MVEFFGAFNRVNAVGVKIMVHLVQLVSEFVTGILLIIGALGKLRNFAWFTSALTKYDLIPLAVVRVAGLTIVFLELLIGASLFRSGWLPWTAYAAAGLFAIFTLVVCISMVRGKFHIECGCSSLWEKAKIGWHLIFRNLGLVGLAFLSVPAQAETARRIYPWAFLLSLALICLPHITRRACTETNATLVGAG